MTEVIYSTNQCWDLFKSYDGKTMNTIYYEAKRHVCPFYVKRIKFVARSHMNYKFQTRRNLQMEGFFNMLL